MAVSGEATVGHIIGFLRLDADQYFRTLEEADAAADKLGKRKVSVKATAKTAAARAELDALGRSVDKVDGAQKRAARSADKLSKSHRGMRPLVMTLLALGPALAPLAGTAVGLAGALGGMGAAGVVALLGIKREMADGTTLGAQFSRIMGDLKNEFHGLETTGANAALAPFNNMVREVTARMPFLNKSVNTFTNLLGSGSTNALTGILDSLQTMEPLLISAGLWVDKLLAKFAQAAAGGGLKGFTDYARSTLPLVTNTLENLVVAVVDLVRAFAPMGAGVLAVLNDVSRVISGLPIGVLTAIASAASAGFLGFQAWRGITAIVNGVVGVLKLMNTEMVVSAGLARGLSLATAGVSLAIGVATMLYARHAEAARQEQAAIDGMTDALVRSHGAIDESIRLGKAKELQDSGAAKVAADAGISLDVLTSAFLNNKSAMELVTQKLLEHQGAGQAVVKGVFEQKGALDSLGGSQSVVTGKGSILTLQMQKSAAATAQASSAARDLTGAQRETAAVIDLTKSAVDRSMAGYNQAAAQYGITGAALRSFTDGQHDAAAQADAARAKMILESDAAGILKGELDKLNGKAISAAEAQNQFDSALSNMSDHVTKTGKKVVLTTKNLNGMSTASVAIRGELIGQVRSMESVIESHGGLAKSTNGAKAEYRALYDQIVKNAVAHGHDKKAVEEFLSTMVNLNDFKPKPTKLDVDKKEADAKLKALQKRLGIKWPIVSIKSKLDTQPVETGIGYIDTLIAGASGQTVTVKTRFVTEGRLPNGGVSTAGGQTKGELIPGRRTGHADGTANANGNIFRAFANGGVENHTAQIARGGPMRLWAEPETGGESYIPHAKSKRARSLEIWEETGRILGANQTTTNNSPVNVQTMIVHDAADIQRKAREARRIRALGRRKSGS